VSGRFFKGLGLRLGLFCFLWPYSVLMLLVRGWVQRRLVFSFGIDGMQRRRNAGISPLRRAIGLRDFGRDDGSWGKLTADSSASLRNDKLNQRIDKQNQRNDKQNQRSDKQNQRIDGRVRDLSDGKQRAAEWPRKDVEWQTKE
jgi:hypothetical protein